MQPQACEGCGKTDLSPRPGLRLQRLNTVVYILRKRSKRPDRLLLRAQTFASVTVRKPVFHTN